MTGSEMVVLPTVHGATLKEDTTDMKYYITLSYGGTTVKYYWDKVSSTKIKLQNTTTPSASQTYTKIE